MYRGHYSTREILKTIHELTRVSVVVCLTASYQTDPATLFVIIFMSSYQDIFQVW